MRVLDAASRGSGTADTTQIVTVPTSGSSTDRTDAVGTGSDVSEPNLTGTSATESATSSESSDDPLDDGGTIRDETRNDFGVSPDTSATTTLSDETNPDADASSTTLIDDTSIATDHTGDNGGNSPDDSLEPDAGTSTEPSDTGDGTGTDISSPDSTEPPDELAELPLDLPNNPVSGAFTVSTEAEWEVDGTMLPTFEIITPTASYWLVKSLGMIVSMSAWKTTDAPQWIAFSSGFRPLRGLPSFGTFDSQQAMTTTLDEDTQTPTHLRLYSESQGGDWQLVYDFYPTHFTLTINSAPLPYGIAYRGVPAGELDSADEFVRADGTSQSALVSYVDDLPGPAEWAYVSDPAVGQSLFMIQHANDELVDRFQIRDNDTALLSFGDGKLTQLPIRFSFGLVDSANHATVESRASFVIDAIQ